MSVATLVTGMLHAVGGCIPASRPLSWIDRGARGWLPVQCYLFRDSDEVLLIDTGLIVHAGAIREGLTSLMAGARRRCVMLTRREPDTMMNLPWIVRELGIDTVCCCGPIDPFDLVERLDEANTSSQIKAMLGIAVQFVRPGGKLEFGRLSVEIIRPTIRILATDWLYESTTRTLFTSDLWAFLTLKGPNCPLVAPLAAQEITADDLCLHLMAKFDWLRGIDTRPMAANLQEIFAGRDVDRICPAYGRPIEGRDAVTRLLALTYEALDRVSRQPAISVMDDFRWLEKARPALAG